MNRNQYTGKKRQLELDRKKKQEEKLKKKLERKLHPEILDADGNPIPSTTEEGEDAEGNDGSESTDPTGQPPSPGS